LKCFIPIIIWLIRIESIFAHGAVIPAKAGIQRLSLLKIFRQIAPNGIHLFNKAQFPGTMPFFVRFFPAIALTITGNIIDP